MEYKYRIQISGEGTVNQLVDSLRKLAESMDNYDDPRDIYEDNVIYAEVVTAPIPGMMNWDED